MRAFFLLTVIVANGIPAVAVAEDSKPDRRIQENMVSGGVASPEQKLENDEQVKINPLKAVQMYCTLADNGHAVQITYNNNSNSTYYCHSACYYTANGHPSVLDCNASAVAHTTNGLFCYVDNAANKFITNVGSNNCP